MQEVKWQRANIDFLKSDLAAPQNTEYDMEMADGGKKTVICVAGRIIAMKHAENNVYIDKEGLHGKYCLTVRTPKFRRGQVCDFKDRDTRKTVTGKIGYKINWHPEPMTPSYGIQVPANTFSYTLYSPEGRHEYHLESQLTISTRKI